MIMGLIVSNSNLKHDARSNTECRTDQRVFDYADKLTGNEEQSLEKKIAKWEDKTGMDIVVMTIDNAQAQSMFGTYMDDTYYEEFEAIKTVAKSFSEQERFGWENWEYNPQSNRSTSDGYVPSDSIIIAANYEAGDVWMSTTGTRVRARISDSKASSLTEKGGKYLREDAEKGFATMIQGAVQCMKSSSGGGLKIPPFYIVILVLICGAIFFITNMSKKAGETTTNLNSYVYGNALVLDRWDIFVR